MRILAADIGFDGRDPERQPCALAGRRVDVDVAAGEADPLVGGRKETNERQHPHPG